MQLLLFRHNWGLPEAPWDQKLAAFRQEGYTGVETAAIPPSDYARFQELLKKHQLRFIPQIFTTGKGVAEHLARRENLGNESKLMFFQ